MCFLATLKYPQAIAAFTSYIPMKHATKESRERKGEKGGENRQTDRQVNINGWVIRDGGESGR